MPQPTLHNIDRFVDFPVHDPLLGFWHERLEIGSTAWFSRMDAEHPTLSFSQHGLSITVRADTRQRGTLYWVAYKKQAGKLDRKYVGRTDALTFERLSDVCRALNPDSAVPQQAISAAPVEVWQADRFKPRSELWGILVECQQEFKKRYGYDMPWLTVELRGRDYYAMPGNQFLGKRAKAIKALLQWVNTGRDNAAARRDGAS